MMETRANKELPLIIPPEWRYAFDDPDAQAVVQVAENPLITSANESRLLQQYSEYQILTSEEAAAPHAQPSLPTSPRFPTTIWKSWDAVRAAVIEHVRANPPPSLVDAQRRWHQGMQFIAALDRSEASHVNILSSILNRMHRLLPYLAPYSQESLRTDMITLLTDPSLPPTTRIAVLNMIGDERIELTIPDWTTILSALAAISPRTEIPNTATVATFTTFQKFLLQFGNGKMEEWLAELLRDPNPERVLQGVSIFIIYNRTLRHAGDSSERKHPSRDTMALASTAARRIALDHDPTVRRAALQVLRAIGYDMHPHTDEHAALGMQLLHDPDPSVQIAAMQLLTKLADRLMDPECMELLSMTRDGLSADDRHRMVATAKLHARMIERLEWPVQLPTPTGLITRARLRQLATTSPHHDVRAEIVASYPLLYEDVSPYTIQSPIFMRSALHAETAFLQDRMLHDPSPNVRTTAMHKYLRRVEENHKYIDIANEIDPTALSSMRPLLHLLEHDPDISVQLDVAENLEFTFFFKSMPDPATEVPKVLATLRRLFDTPHRELQMHLWRAHLAWMTEFSKWVPANEAYAALANASHRLDLPDSASVDDIEYAYIESIDSVVGKAPRTLFSTDTFVWALATLRTYYNGSRTVSDDMELRFRKVAAVSYTHMLNARQRSLFNSGTAIAASGPLRDELLAIIRDSDQCLSDPECPLRIESVDLLLAATINLGQEMVHVAVK